MRRGVGLLHRRRVTGLVFNHNMKKKHFFYYVQITQVSSIENEAASMLLRIISLILPVRIKKPDSLICTIFCGQALKMVHSVKKVCLLLYKQFCMSALSVLLQDLCSWETLASVSPIQTSSGSRSKKTNKKKIKSKMHNNSIGAEGNTVQT